MSEEESTPETTILSFADIASMKDTEIYKILEDDISFLESFLSLQEIPLNTPECNAKAGDFNAIFLSYIQRKSHDYHWLLKLLFTLASIRPKLIGIFPTLLNSFYSVYSAEKDEIIQYIMEFTDEVPYPLLLYILRKNYKHNPDGKIDTKYFDLFPDDDIINAIYHDDYDTLYSILLSKHDFNFDEVIDEDESYAYENLLRLTNFSFDYTLLDIAALFGSVKCFKYIFLNMESIPESTALYAIQGGSIEIVQILNQKDIDFSECFNLSIRYHQYELAEWILLNCDSYDTPLSGCLLYYNFKAFLYYSNHYDLTDQHANDNYPIPSDSYDALHAACYIGHLPLVKYLIENCKMNKDEKTMYHGVTPLQIACQEGNFQIVKYLIEQAKVSYEIYPELIMAIQQNNLYVVDYYFKVLNASKDYLQDSKFSFLYYACESGNLLIVKYLIEQIGVGPENDSSKAPFFEACKSASNYDKPREYLLIIKYFIDVLHFDINSRNQEGKTALTMAISKNELKTIEYLINEFHPDPEQNRFKGMTPSEYCESINGFPKVLEYLKSVGY